MSIKTRTENFWIAYNQGNLDLAIQRYSKLEQWYEEHAINDRTGTADEYKKAYLKSMSWAIIQAHEMKAEKLKKYYGDPHKEEPKAEVTK